MVDGNSIIEGKVAERLTTTASPTDDKTASGIIRTMGLGTTFTALQIGYMKGSSGVELSDASTATLMPAVVMVIEAGNKNEQKSCLYDGIVRDDSWTWTTGSVMYASTATGEMTQTAPAASGDQVQIVGIAMSTTTIFFKPSYSVVVVA